MFVFNAFGEKTVIFPKCVVFEERGAVVPVEKTYEVLKKKNNSKMKWYVF